MKTAAVVIALAAGAAALKPNAVKAKALQKQAGAAALAAAWRPRRVAASAHAAHAGPLARSRRRGGAAA